MPIPVIAEIVPQNNGKFAILEDINLRGGYQTIDLVTTMNAIPVDNRKPGMRVYIQATGDKYTLENDLITWTKDIPIILPQEQTFQQVIPSSNWGPFTHNLNKYPTVIVLDSAKNIIIGNINYIDVNTFSISFGSTFSGEVRIN